MTRTEERLTDALRAAGRAIKDHDLRSLPEAGSEGAARRGGRWLRWLAAASAAVAAALIAVFAVVPALQQSPAPGSAAGGSQVVGVGGFPTGTAVDTATSTVYVAEGQADALAMISTSTCGASAHAHCGAAKSAPTGGSDPVGVAVDSQTHTVYVVNTGSNTVAVINAAACNATDTAGCAQVPVQVHVGNGPEFLAVNAQTDTVYVANTVAGTVSVIDGQTCNATDTSGCVHAPATIPAGAGAFPIAVDQASNTVYVGVSTGVAVIDGAGCDSVSAAGCGRMPVIAPVNNQPAGISVDDQAHTVYISGQVGTVALLNSGTCDSASIYGSPPYTPITHGCLVAATVTVGLDPRGDAFDAATSTVYVTNAASNDVSLLNAKTCSAANTAGCGASPRTFPVGRSPRRVAVDDANHSVYVVNVGANTVSVVDSSSCNATVTSGCPSRPPAGTAATPRTRAAPLAARMRG